MKTSDAFEKAYAKLNSGQKEAVDTIDGPVMVIAGPGTGKTSILTLRIANIVKETDTAPENILALTFTESGVQAMRKRLIELMGSAGYRVAIYTFHSFCNDLIQHHPEYFSEIIGRTAASDVDQIQIIETILEKNNFQKIKPYGDPLFYVYPVKSYIQELKREGFTPTTFKKELETIKKNLENDPDAIHQKGAYKGKKKADYVKQEERLARSMEVAELYEQYQQALSDRKQYDYDDMILETIKAFKQYDEFLLIVQEQYQYLLADEHQDANNAQNSILEMLSNFHDSPNIFIVGDEKQAIFRFQGASLSNFLYFKNKYPSTTLVQLTENYRSTQTILDDAQALISNTTDVAEKDQEALRKSLKSNTDAGAKNLVKEYENQHDEHLGLIKDIQAQIAKGIDPSEIAVLYRNNRDVFDIAHLFEKTDIPYTIVSDQNILHHPDVIRLLKICNAIEHVTSTPQLAELLHIDIFKLPSVDVMNVLSYIYRERDVSLVDVIHNTKLLQEIGVNDTVPFEHVAELLDLWKKSSKNQSVIETIELIIHKSGLLEDVLQNQGSFERLAVIDRFFSEVKNVVAGRHTYTLHDLLQHFEILETYGISISAPRADVKGGVTLMTAHKSKGLEFDHVYIVGAIRSKWDGKRGKTYFTDILQLDAGHESHNDERRLFFVALTRARKTVTISYPKNGADGREFTPSMFIDELQHVEHISGEHVTLDISLPKRLEEKKQYGPSLHDKEYLTQRFLEQGLSVTALNNYIKNPWQFFYANLLRIPQAYSKPQMYGNAVHGALKDFFDQYKKTETLPKEDELLELFEHYLSRQGVDEMTFNELMQKGNTSLRGWYQTYLESFEKDIQTEFRVKGVVFKVDDVEIPLTGILDKIIRNEDGSVTVLDYKTSKPKTRNEIEGNTKSSDGSLKRQLVFYKLLLDGLEDGNYHMKRGAIDFVEPNPKGDFKKEVFDISEEDVDGLREEMDRVCREILSFSFWNTPCDPETCDYADLHSVTDFGGR